MSLARDIAELEARLRERTDVNPFAPLASSGLPSTPDFNALLSKIAGQRDAAAMLRLCLQALRVQHQQLQPRLIDAELVATLPEDTPGIARPTESAIREMVGSATKEVIALGYEFTDLGIVQLFAEAASRGVDVIAICDRGRGSAARIRDSWPPGCAAPRLFHDRERKDAAQYASMHAKCLLVDGTDLLVTSANFTFHGLHGNIEVGLRVRGVPAAEARKIFSHLVDNNIVEAIG